MPNLHQKFRTCVQINFVMAVMMFVLWQISIWQHWDKISITVSVLSLSYCLHWITMATMMDDK